MKLLAAVVIGAAVLLSVFQPTAAFAQSTQISYTVNLNWFSLQVTYPSEVMPGDTFNVSVLGTPKTSSVSLQNLTATIFYADAAGLHQIASQILLSNPANGYGYYGAPPTGSFSKSFQVLVPLSAPRTSFVALFSEAAQYNYQPYYYGYSPFSYWYFGDPLFYSYYPTTSTSTDQAIAPLSYIKATTPEYVALQSEYRMVQQQLNQTQTLNQQLEATIAQQNATIGQLNQQLTAANATAGTYEAVAGAFIIIAAILAAFSFYKLRNKAKTTDANAPAGTQ